jgi:hypothetical protein
MVVSETRLISLLSRTLQAEAVGSERVLTDNGWDNKTLWDVNRRVIHTIDDLELTTPRAHLTPRLQREVVRCPNCAKTRLIPDGDTLCLFCLRGEM